jgi:serine/arginine repetitive matrix protein 2
MIKAQRGVLGRKSLEDNCLSADGKEMAGACEFFQPPVVFENDTMILNCYLDCAVPVFTRPAPTTRSCSSTCTSGGNTPLLSSSD